MGYSVYYLSDPRVGKPRYYGVTKSTLDKRLRNHHSIGYGGESPKDKWIKELGIDGVKPSITLIAEYDNRDDGLKLETSLIINGGDLFNIIAGDGYKNPKFKNRYIFQSIESDKRRMRRENKYGRRLLSVTEDKKEAKIKATKDITLTKNKPGRPRKEKKQKRKLNLAAQQIEARLANLRPYWFTKRVV